MAKENSRGTLLRAGFYPPMRKSRIEIPEPKRPFDVIQKLLALAGK